MTTNTENKNKQQSKISNPMVTVEINGKQLCIESGRMIIEVADLLGIKIPRFCYHEKLSIAANCRMCLVQVAGANKPLPACATPITDGMKIFTHSDVAKSAQKSVMEFLLINHPLDCPICDQGGECELQDVSMSYGKDVSRYTEAKRSVEDKNIGSLISTEMTRCIHCTRCVRFGEEIAGVKELGLTGRGEHARIETFLSEVNSELSGNMIDLCPVGALTSKPFRFQARSWEMISRPSVAAHDCLGSNTFAHIRNNKVMRVVPQNNKEINEMWLSDRDRFSYEALSHEDRLTEPMIKVNGKWCNVSWSQALQEVSTKLKNILSTAGAEQLMGIISPSSTLEEMFLFQSILRDLGCNNIDHRLREQDISDQQYRGLYPGFTGFKLADLEEQKGILLIGAYPRKAQPMLNHWLRKAQLAGCNIASINPVKFNINYELEIDLVSEHGDIIFNVAALLKCLLVEENLTDKKIDQNYWQKLLANIKILDEHREIVKLLLNSQHKNVILLGSFVSSHPQSSLIRNIVLTINELTKGKIGFITDGANSAGAWIAGAIPHRTVGGMSISNFGLSTYEGLAKKLSAYILFNIEPEFDCYDAHEVLDNLNKAELTVCFSTYSTPKMLKYADVILPLSPSTENTGTLVNIEGVWQNFEQVVKPLEASRPGWQILYVLAKNLGALSAAKLSSITEIRNEIKEKLQLAGNRKEAVMPMKNITKLTTVEDGVLWITMVNPYGVDGICRRAKHLQNTNDANAGKYIYINPQRAAKLELKDDELVQVHHENSSISLPVKIDDGVPVNAVFAYIGTQHLFGEGKPYHRVTLQKEI